MANIRITLNKIFDIKYFPLFLLLICILTYGILIPFLGFYWDDFPYIWFSHIGGAAGVFRAVAEDRPVLGLFYSLTTSLIGENPIYWQIFGLLAHWFCALCVYWLLIEIWPDHKKESALVSLLFLVFPGFSQHWISVIYSQAFLLFSIYFFSHILMIRSVRKSNNNWFLTLSSVILSLIITSAMEYTVGLELLRPMIIWIIISQNKLIIPLSEKIKSVIIQWLPYLIGLILFGIYRVFYATSVLYSVRISSDLRNNPIGLLVDFAQSSIKNLYKAGFLAWIRPFQNPAQLNLSHSIDRVYIVLIPAMFLLLYVFINSFFSDKESPSSDRNEILWAKQALFLGISSIFLAGIPFFAVRYELLLTFPYDRLSLPMMLGSALLLYSLILILLKNKLSKKIFFCLIMSFAIAAQFLFANSYRQDWEDFRAFFWQLRWRIPTMEKGTMLLTDKLPLNYYSDNSLTAPLNWLYSPVLNSSTMPYILNFTEVRLGNRVPSLEPNIPIDQYYRIVTFKGNTSQSLVFQYSPPGCLHILDPILDAHNPTLTPQLINAVPLTNFSTIIDIAEESKNQPAFLFGNETTHNWCYYYEKAALANQFQEWDQVVKIGDVAFTSGGYPNDPIERFPFIEGYAHAGNLTRALELSRKTIEISPLYKNMLCHLWDRISKADDIGPLSQNVNEYLISELNCINP
jgi:hypothetical protein